MRKSSQTNEPMIFYGGGDGIPPLVLCRIFLLAGVLLFCIGLNPALWTPSDIGPFGQGELVFGSALFAIGGWLLKIRKDILRLLSTDALCARMGIPEDALKQIAQQQAIRPRYIVNGQDYYAPADFDEEAAKTLLRATSPADQHDILLRSSADALQSPQQLLRASDSSEN